MLNQFNTCPCCSGIDYAKCCKPYHAGRTVPNAEALMRSRYSAYALHLASYIIDTTHPENSQYLADKVLWLKEINDFTNNTTFQKLEVLEFTDGKNEAFVTFNAHMTQHGNDASFTERSRFKRIKGCWLYLDGHITS